MASNQYGLFWNSSSGDRVYDADVFAEWLRKFFTTGVFSGDLQVTADGSGMDIEVATGYANIAGKVRFFDTAQTFTLATANGAYDRIDNVVVECNYSDRIISVKVVTGTPALSPVAPTPTRDASAYQLVIAQVTVAAGAVSVSQASVTDTRTDSDLCGVVTGTVEEIDWSQIVAQFNAYYTEFKSTHESDFNTWYSTFTSSSESDFNTWFDHMKDQLTTDAAGNLQTQIDDLDDDKVSRYELGDEETATITDGVATFEAYEEAPVTELVAGIEPVQDLHGYDNPWPAGGGKNLLPLVLTDIKAANTGGTWSGNVYTAEDVDFTVNTDDAGNVTSILVNGTASGLIIFKLAVNLSIAAGSIMTGCPAGGSTSTYVLNVAGTNYSDIGSGATVSSAVTANVNLDIFSGCTAPNLIFYPMIRLATEVDSTFAPYTNICPISGHTEMDVENVGKNLLPMTLAGIKAANTGGTWSGNVYTANDVDFTVNTDDAGNVTSILVNGTASGLIIFKLAVNLSIAAGSIMTGCPAGGSTSTYVLNVAETNYSDIGSGATVSSAVTANVNLDIFSGTAATNLTFYPMIRKASDTDATFEPYRATLTKSISFGQTVYGGELNVKTGVLTVTYKTATNLGSLPISKDGLNRWMISVYLDDPWESMEGKQWNINYNYDFYVDKLPIVIEAEAVEGLSSCSFYGHANSVELRIRMDSNKYTAQEAYDFARSLTVSYPCNPTTIQLGREEVFQFIGQNNISADTGDIIECKYIPVGNDKACIETDTGYGYMGGKDMALVVEDGQAKVMLNGEDIAISGIIKKSATLTAGATTLAFTDDRFGSNTMILSVGSDLQGVEYTNVSIAGTTITFTFAAQASDATVYVAFMNF